MFYGSDTHAESAAAIFTIIASCRLSSIGSQLIDEAFGRSNGLPRLAFNSLQTLTEQSEHNGLMNLMKGVFSAFRNPTAHEAK